MEKYELYEIAKKLGLNKSDIDDFLNISMNKSRMSTISATLYKGGTHYGTISIKEII
jgi:hypothetical protein